MPPGTRAVRASLGATRRRLVAQLLSESSLLTLAAGILGILLAQVLVEALPVISGMVGLGALDAGLDRGVLLFALGLSLLAGTTKNREARTFPFTDELRSLLPGQKAKADALRKESSVRGCFFRTGKKTKGRQIKGFKRSWATACRKAGVPGRIVHDFRRTAVRNLVRAGVPERVAMKMTGHKTRAVFERYNIVSEGDLREAARRLERYTESLEVREARQQR